MMAFDRGGPSARLARAWEDGRTERRARWLGVVGGGYRGLLGAREWLYARGLLRSRRLPCPVISIGNLTVGGTGKTPGTELAVRTLLERGRRPAVVSRGYGRRTHGVQVVADAAAIRLDPEDAGDEPFLLARRLPGVPVVVGSHRHEAARLALERFDVDAIVLDDGFQHRTLRKDLEIVMARCRNPWGNGRVLPAGPLREPLEALRRADLVVASGASRPEDAAEVAATVEAVAPDVPVLAARYVPVECWEAAGMRPVPLEDLRGRKLLGFAGIGSPRAFESTLTGIGVNVLDLISFPDHYWYSKIDLERLGARAEADGLVTTEKDWVRLRMLPAPRRPLYVVSVRLALLGGDAVWRRVIEGACSTG